MTPAWKTELREYAEALITALIIAGFIIIFIGQNFVVQGNSMLPTLHDRERLFVEKISYRLREPRRGEIIVFKFPAIPRRKFIKRVIGIPGDEVAIRNNRVYVNGVALKEDYLLALTQGDFGPVYVPAGHVFVLGDNRNNSEDSRFSAVGFVPRHLIVGHALFRWWPLPKVGLMRRPAIFTQITN